LWRSASTNCATRTEDCNARIRIRKEEEEEEEEEKRRKKKKN
jgi:hypothetical protein